MTIIPGHPYLTRILNKGDAWELLGDFDALMKASDQRIHSARSQSDAVEAAKFMHDFARDHFHLLLVGLYKVREIARGIHVTLDSQNDTVLFSLVRSLIEHTAALAYQLNALEKATNDLPKKVDLKTLRESIERHHRAAKRLYYNEKAEVHVHDMIKALSASYETARRDYDELCEFVHPNHGSNRIVSGGQLGIGKIGPQSAEISPDLTKAHYVIERCARLIEDEFSKTSSYHLIKIGSWIDIACQDGAKMSQLFSVRSAISGDGRTKETAFFFMKARTHHEAMEAFYEFFRNGKMTLLKRQIAAVENGFLYDEVATDKGRLWFKFNVPK